MAEYIDLDKKVVVIDTRGNERETTARHILDFNKGVYEVELIVRCKDCRHRDPEDQKCDSGETERQGCPFPVHDDYFCAYGERSKDGWR